MSPQQQQQQQLIQQPSRPFITSTTTTTGVQGAEISSSSNNHNNNYHTEKKPKYALVMGVANHRSIAWACVQSLVREDFHVICTYQKERFRHTVEQLVTAANAKTTTTTAGSSLDNSYKIITALPCNVEDELPIFFQQRLHDILPEGTTLDAIVHSIAYAPPSCMKPPPGASGLLQTSLEDYVHAHHISAYSFLEMARCAQPWLNTTSSLTTITYLGSSRAIPNYNIMGPAKASLESIVRGLALELGSDNNSSNSSVRVNAVSAGPLPTMAARGIDGFGEMRQHAIQQSPLKRSVTLEEVADTVTFLATRGTGITGQVIYVDGGYSIV